MSENKSLEPKQFDVDGVLNSLPRTLASHASFPQDRRDAEDLGNNLATITGKASIWEMRNPAAPEIEELVEKGFRQMKEWYTSESARNAALQTLEQLVQSQEAREKRTGEKYVTTELYKKYMTIFSPPEDQI